MNFIIRADIYYVNKKLQSVCIFRISSFLCKYFHVYFFESNSQTKKESPIAELSKNITCNNTLFSNYPSRRNRIHNYHHSFLQHSYQWTSAFGHYIFHSVDTYQLCLNLTNTQDYFSLPFAELLY